MPDSGLCNEDNPTCSSGPPPCPTSEPGETGVAPEGGPTCGGGGGGGGSPIIVDTTGHGFQLTSAEDGVMFDISGNGHPVRLAWTAADSGNAFLSLDRNHNGKIDNGKELFGNFTEQPPCSDGGASCFNGYRALAEFDKPENGGNGDGIIDWHDAVYSKLLLWIDENHDGISQPNELHTLPELGVYSISLHYRDDRYYFDQYGNWFHYQAALNPDPEDGESKDGRVTYDVFFVIANPDTARSRSRCAEDNPLCECDPANSNNCMTLPENTLAVAVNPKCAAAKMPLLTKLREKFRQRGKDFEIVEKPAIIPGQDGYYADIDEMLSLPSIDRILYGSESRPRLPAQP